MEPHITLRQELLAALVVVALEVAQEALALRGKAMRGVQVLLAAAIMAAVEVEAQALLVEMVVALMAVMAARAQHLLLAALL